MRGTLIKLRKRDREWLQGELKRSEFCHQERIRAQVLLMSDKGFSRTDIVRALNTSTSTVSRTRRRYVESGGQDTVYESTGNRGAERALSLEDEQVIASVACTPPPEGHARWTTRLVFEEARKKGVPKVSLETIRCCLRDHRIRPWREKNVGHSGSQRRVHQEDVRRSSAARTPI